MTNFKTKMSKKIDNEFLMKMSKQKLLGEAREVLEGCGLIIHDEEGSFRCGILYKNKLKLCPECEQALQEIKDQWEESCGKVWNEVAKGFIPTVIHVCDTKGNPDKICLSCQIQNKEFKQICEVVGI